MTLNPLLTRWRDKPATAYSGLALALSVVVALSAWSAIALMLHWQWRETVAAEMRHNANTARALKEHTLRILDTVDQAMDLVQVAANTGTLTGQVLVRTANETGMSPHILTQMSFVDAKGNFVGSNLDPDGSRSQHVSLMDREHIRVHLLPQQAGTPQLTRPKNEWNEGLFISKPLVGKVSGVRTIQLSRRVMAPDGSVAGVIVASLNQRHFIDVYRGVELGTYGMVELTGLDGAIRARVVGGQAMEIAGSQPGTLTSALRSQPSGALLSLTADGRQRIVGFSRVGDYGLAVLSATAQHEALAPWRTLRDTVLLVTLVLSLAIATFVAAFVVSVRKLTRSQAQAQRANQAKSEFLAAMSHELRTPLTSIRGFAELMELRSKDALIREQSQLIRQGAEHLNALLTEILDLAKIEARAMRTHPEPVALPELVNEVAELFRVSAVAKSLQLNTRLHPAVAQPLVTDRLKLKQILSNLLSNAIKFTTQGQIELAVEPAPDGRHMLLHVTDTGPGIAPQMQEVIFEKFSQGGARVSYEHGGTGLGLSLSRALATLLGGTLTVQSHPGEGSRFTLALPIQP